MKSARMSCKSLATSIRLQKPAQTNIRGHVLAKMKLIICKRQSLNSWSILLKIADFRKDQNFLSASFTTTIYRVSSWPRQTFFHVTSRSVIICAAKLWQMFSLVMAKYSSTNLTHAKLKSTWNHFSLQHLLNAVFKLKGRSSRVRVRAGSW